MALELVLVVYHCVALIMEKKGSRDIFFFLHRTKITKYSFKESVLAAL